jgi:hypothetical protein
MLSKNKIAPAGGFSHDIYNFDRSLRNQLMHTYSFLHYLISEEMNVDGNEIKNDEYI